MKIPMILSGGRLSILITVGLILGSSTIVRAQQPSAIDKSMVQKALMVKVFDQLSAQCAAGRGFNAQESATVAAWEKEQEIGALRTQIGQLSTRVQTQLDQGATSVLAEISRRQPDANPCSLAMTITRISGSSSAAASRSPSRGADSSANRTGTTTELPSSSGSSRPSDNANVANLVAKIDSFGFDTRMTMGVGGFMTQDVYPVVLFRNGEALKDVKGLSYAGGLEAHRRDRPQSWTRWQRSGGKVQLQTSKGWKALPFPTTYQTLPSQFRLDGTYRSMSGTGNVAIGGGASVAAWRNYTFFSDGRVMRDGGAGSSVSGGGSSVVTASAAPNQQGRYQVDGLMLRIKYDDGSTENRIIITNPNDPKGAIWLDGTGYVQRKR